MSSPIAKKRWLILGMLLAVVLIIGATILLVGQQSSSDGTPLSGSDGATGKVEQMSLLGFRDLAVLADGSVVGIDETTNGLVQVYSAETAISLNYPDPQGTTVPISLEPRPGSQEVFLLTEELGSGTHQIIRYDLRADAVAGSYPAAISAVRGSRDGKAIGYLYRTETQTLLVRATPDATTWETVAEVNAGTVIIAIVDEGMITAEPLGSGAYVLKRYAGAATPPVVLAPAIDWATVNPSGNLIAVVTDQGMQLIDLQGSIQARFPDLRDGPRLVWWSDNLLLATKNETNTVVVARTNGQTAAIALAYPGELPLDWRPVGRQGTNLLLTSTFGTTQFLLTVQLGPTLDRLQLGS